VDGQKDPTPWGSSIGVALEYLKGSGLITKKFGGQLTEKGRAVLALGPPCPREAHEPSSRIFVEFTYTNHRGEKRTRRVMPLGVEYIQQPGYGYEPGWFLRAFDPEKTALRAFRLSHIDIQPGEHLSLCW